MQHTNGISVHGGGNEQTGTYAQRLTGPLPCSSWALGPVLRPTPACACTGRRSHHMDVLPQAFACKRAKQHKQHTPPPAPPSGGRTRCCGRLSTRCAGRPRCSSEPLHPRHPYSLGTSGRPTQCRATGQRRQVCAEGQGCWAQRRTSQTKVQTCVQRRVGAASSSQDPNTAHI